MNEGSVAMVGGGGRGGRVNGVKGKYRAGWINGKPKREHN
jgi:hypothetical protein